MTEKKSKSTTPAMRWGALLLILITGAIAYLNTFDGEWVWDDVSSVLLHKHVQDPAKITQLFKEDQHAFGRGQGNFYRPLVSVSFMVDTILSGGVEEGEGIPELPTFMYHMSNMLWHVLAAWMLFLLFLRIGVSYPIAFSVAMLWVVHPLHTEAVAYISGRADMMSGAFIFAALWAAMAKGSLPLRATQWLLSALCFIAAMLSKESGFIFAVLLGVVIFMLPVAGDEKKSREYAYRTIPWAVSLALLAGYGILRVKVLTFAEASATTAAPLSQRMLEAGQALAFYLKVMFWPTHLHMEQTLADTPAWTAVIGWGFLAVCIVMIVVALRSRKAFIALGLAWFLVAWFPISGIFPLNAPMAEHWMYVPMAGFWLALLETLFWGLDSTEEARSTWRYRASVGAVAAACLIFLLFTVARNQEWDNNNRLFRATLRENPDSLRVQYNLAVAYQDIDENPAGAQRHFDVVLDMYQAQRGEGTPITEAEYEVHHSLAQELLKLNAYDAAYPHSLEVAQALSNPNVRTRSLLSLVDMGRSALAAGDIRQADFYFNQVIKIMPEMQPELQKLLAEGSLKP